MTKLTTFIAVLVLGLTSSAFAADYDKTGVSLSAEGEKFGVSLSTGASRDFADDARVLGIKTTSHPINWGLQYIENGNVDDYRISVETKKEVEAPFTGISLYGVAEAHYDFGDSFTNKELRLSPYAGVKGDMGKIKPFVEAGYDWKSTEGSYLDFSKADSYAKLGADIPMTGTTTLTANVLQKMDKDFNKSDREVQLAFKVKF